MAESAPTPADEPKAPNPADALKRHIRRLCVRIVQGKAAIRRWEVVLQRTVRIVSIVLTSLGSAGVIADKVSGNLPGEAGWAFWGSIIVLLFGILLQVLNELRVEQTATEAIALSEGCAVFETQLGMALEEPDPRTAVERLRGELNTIVLKYHRALPPMTDELKSHAEELADSLIEANEGGWELPPEKRARK
jgi:hypothetical protein